MNGFYDAEALHAARVRGVMKWRNALAQIAAAVLVLGGYSDSAAVADAGAGGAGCAADIAPPGGDGVIDVSDLLALLSAWGVNPGHAADFNGDGAVDVSDLLQLLGAWGACPTGSCCLSNGNCFAAFTNAQCSAAGGTYGGDGSACGNCTPQGASCAGQCGASAPAGCWCDEWCCTYGDCCLDHPAVCGGCMFQCPIVAKNECDAQFVYDSCVTTNALGLGESGVIAWAQRFHSEGPITVITNIATAYGEPFVHPGVAPCSLVGWAIMTDSGAGPGTVIVQGVDPVAFQAVFTDRHQVFNTGLVTVPESFYVVVWVHHWADAPAPMDQSNPGPYADDVWLMFTGGVTFHGFDPENPALKARMADLGLPTVWRLRANHY